MVKNNAKNKWLRRYRVFFVVGIAILSLQIFLAARFLALNKRADNEETQWEPSSPDEIEPHSARKSDEDDISFGTQKASKVKFSSNQTHLQLEDLGFQPPCVINTKEALSAISRAKTQKCKQLISNVTCLSQENKLYPLELTGSCPAGEFATGKEMGCFKDEKNFRLLNGYVGTNKNENSPRYCIKLCLQSGFPYAGVQYSNECFCGSDEPPLTSKVPDSSCNMKCPGDQLSTCGGFYTMNVYQTGIKKFVPQTANETSVGEKPAKIVFLLTLNGRALRQVKRLIKILYHKDHYYYIHVDVRQDYLFRELLVLEQLSNVRLTRQRFATIWGGASLLEMLRSCMSELLAMKEWDWDFVLNLSESDFPVKSVSELTKFLTSNKNRNFVKSHGREVQRFIQKQGLDKTFVECETRMWRVGNRKLPFGIQIDGGSDWVALSKPFVEYVADSEPSEFISGLLRVFKHTLLPAESFFHTVLRNSRFCNTYIDNNLHVTNWKRKLGCKCQYKHVVDWCGCSPNDFRPEDWSKILNTQSRQLYFARKFEPVINQAVILQLELWLFGLDKPSRPVRNLHSYWQNVYHHQDLGVATDDLLMTFANSIARHTARLLSNSSSCNVTVGPLLEVNSFHNRDSYKYSLFYFNNSLEVAVKPLRKFTAMKPSPLMEHLVSLSVSSDYDQKEQVSRNFLQVLSSYSEPVLIYYFETYHTSKQYNLTCLWIDPIGNLQEATDFSIDESSLRNHVKPTLKQPLLPGVWKAKIIYKDTLLAQVTFLIIPVQFLYGNAISEPQMSILHGGLSFSRDLRDSFSKFLPNISQKGVLEEIAMSNSKRQGEELLEWIDSLIFNFYDVEKVCVNNDERNVCGNKLNACANANWSSFAPDPKSAITNLNYTSGCFDIW